jgi:DNA polymerase-3 subunit alpha
LRSVRDIPISQLFDENVAHESIFTVAGLITNVQRKVSRQGSNWAIVTVEDLEGAIDVLFFANTYQQHALSLIEDRIVSIRGRVDKREDTPRFTALDMSIPNVNQAPIGPFIIRIESQRCTPPLVDRMKEILRSHPGTREVHLRIEGGAKETTFRLDDGLRVTASPSLSADLKSILGPDCLV